MVTLRYGRSRSEGYHLPTEQWSIVPTDKVEKKKVGSRPKQHGERGGEEAFGEWNDSWSLIFRMVSQPNGITKEEQKTKSLHKLYRFE